jgi:hypothetical protein
MIPVGNPASELRRWFRAPESAFGKSIQRNWAFYGTFIFNPFQGVSVGRDIEFPPIIQPFHIVDVSIPTYSFERKVMMYGQVPRSFPILNFEGFVLDITMEEDEQGTVDYFINWNQRNIIDKDGYYNPPDKAKLKAFVLEVQDKGANPVVYYIFHDIYFVNASAASYSYTGNESIKRQVSFGCDRLSHVYTKQNILTRGPAAISGLVSTVKNNVTSRFKR